MNTVLIVDDSKITGGIVKNIFAGMNIACNFLEAKNGRMALEALESNRVSLVLLDWNKAGMNGLQFLKQIRAMPIYNDLPIIMATSEAAKYIIVEALQNGATDYLVKPINENELREKISDILF